MTKKRVLRRSAKTGRTVTPEDAAANPDTTVTETVRPPSVAIADLVESGLTESTLFLLLNDVARSYVDYPGRGELMQAIEKQLDRARD